jgi:membrane associated rhomboid family serine protease
MAVMTDLHALAAAELSLTARLRYVALLLAALAMTIVVAALWATEPALPASTQAAFAAMIAIGGGWIAFASWVLTRRYPLFARDRVIAGRMAVAFACVFVAGALAVGVTTGMTSAYAAAAVGVAMAAAAAALLVRAQRTVARLSARRDELQRALGH